MKNEKWRHQDYASGDPMCSPFDGIWTNHERGIASPQSGIEWADKICVEARCIVPLSTASRFTRHASRSFVGVRK